MSSPSKSHQIWGGLEDAQNTVNSPKREVKLSAFANDAILYRQNTKEFTHTHNKTCSHKRVQQGYRFLYIVDQYTKINCISIVQSINAKHILWKLQNNTERKLKMIYINGKTSHINEIHLILLWWQYSLNWYTKSKQCLWKSRVGFLSPEIKKVILKFIWKCMGGRLTKTTLKKMNKVGGPILPNFKSYYTKLQ